MAFGTKLVPKVDKIVGPGNLYVAKAKEKLFGRVGIDMIAGPSEVVIVADDTVDPLWVVQDMFAQAEHDELAQAIVISASQNVLDNVRQTIEEKIKEEQRRDNRRRSQSPRSINKGPRFERGSKSSEPSVTRTSSAVDQRCCRVRQKCRKRWSCIRRC